jgi:DNA polymerase
LKPKLSEPARQYLRQVRDLYGDEIYLDLKKNDPIPPSNPGDLDAFNLEISECQKCSLGKSRTKFVFGVGDPNANLLLVGEAPGRDEDIKGEPFVGKSGRMLDKILRAIDRSREKDVFICNVLKCRPPENRDPLATEVEQCEPHLLNQIRLIKPKLIVSLGRVAGQTLLRVDKPLKSMRETIHDYHGIPLIVTYHPAALLRNENLKRPTWDDFKTIRDFLEA